MWLPLCRFVVLINAQERMRCPGAGLAGTRARGNGMRIAEICRAVLPLAALALSASPAWSAVLPTCASTIEASGVKVVRVERNGVLVLEDGRAVHLEGLLLPQGAKDHAPDFLAQQAVSTLSDLSRGRTVTLAVEIPKEDRYGRLRAQVEFPQDNDEP